jgi:hypothetical protein
MINNIKVAPISPAKLTIAVATQTFSKVAMMLPQRNIYTGELKIRDSTPVQSVSDFSTELLTTVARGRVSAATARY